MESRVRIAFGMALGALILAAVTLLISAGLYARSVDATNDINREGAARRDQACRGAEGAYKTEIEQLRQTYDYFAHPPKGLEQTIKDPRVVQTLHDQERDAAKDTDRFGQFVAPYCDESGVGLKEPDPTLPKRPKGLP